MTAENKRRKFFLKALPAFIRRRIEHREGVQKVAANIGWLFFDKFLRMGMGLFIGAWVARYLGPEKYGMFNYAFAYVALFGSFATFGLEKLVIRELVSRPADQDTILGSTFFVRLLGAGAAAVLATVSIGYVRANNHIIFILVILSSTGLIVQAFKTLDLYFQSQVQSKYTVIAYNSAFLVSSLVKVILILNKADLFAFAGVALGEIILGTFILILFYHFKANAHIVNWKPSMFQATSFIRESWPLILANISSMLNMRIDQIFIGKMLNDAAVGNYSVAVKISEIWLMIPMMLGGSIYPKIIEAKKKSHSLYIYRLHKIFFFMCCFTLPVALLVSFNSEFIIGLIFGNRYSDAGTILSIHIWSGVPYMVTFAYGQMFYIEKLIKLTFFTSLFTPVCNIGLNMYLIPRYGAVGAAVATMVTSFGVCMISLSLLYVNVKKKNRKNGTVDG